MKVQVVKRKGGIAHALFFLSRGASEMSSSVNPIEDSSTIHKNCSVEEKSMNKKAILSILIFLMTSAMIILVNIQRGGAIATYHLRISVGDRYEYTVEKANNVYFTNDSNQIEYLKAGDLLEFEVVSEYEEPLYYSNGSIAFYEERALCDISRNNRTVISGGSLSFPQYSGYLIPFLPCDDDYLEALNNWMNETREANGWNYSLEHVDVLGDKFQTVDYGMESLFQRSTGVLLGFKINTSDQNGTLVGEALDFTLMPEFPSFLILPLLMVATLLTVTVYRRKVSIRLARAQAF